jgi:hypothetical protein
MKTSPSLDPPGSRKHRCSTGRWVAVALAVALLLAVGGCGGGELAGQAGTAPAPAVTATTTTPTVPSATTQGRPTTTPSATTPPRTRTTRTTTQATTPDPSTTPSTTATQPPETTPAEDPARPIEETAQLTLVEKISAVEYRQAGTVVGTYDGTMTLHAKVESRGVVVRFTVTAADGTISGRSLATLGLIGDEPLVPISGTAVLTNGTGAFAGVRGRGLVVKGRVALDGSRGTVRLTGKIFL